MRACPSVLPANIERTGLANPSTHPPSIHTATHLISAHRSTHLPTHPPIHPSINPISNPSIHPHSHLRIHPSLHPSINPISNPSIHLSTHTSIYPSIHTLTRPSTYPPMHPPVHQSNSQSLYPSNTHRVIKQGTHLNVFINQPHCTRLMNQSKKPINRSIHSARAASNRKLRPFQEVWHATRKWRLPAHPTLDLLLISCQKTCRSRVLVKENSPKDANDRDTAFLCKVTCTK